MYCPTLGLRPEEQHLILQLNSDSGQFRRYRFFCRVLQPSTISLQLGKGDREKRLNDPESENQSENNADNEKHPCNCQDAPAPFPVQDQHDQVKQKTINSEIKPAKKVIVLTKSRARTSK